MAVSEFGAVDQHAHLAGLGGDDHRQYALVAQNTIANRPAPGRAGRLFYATDEDRTYYDNGASWEAFVGPGGGVLTGRLSLGVGGELVIAIPQKAATDAPSTYPEGLSTFSVSDATLGWPISAGTITTLRSLLGARWFVTQEFVRANSNVASVVERYFRSGYIASDLSIDGWAPWQKVANDQENFNLKAQINAVGHVLSETGLRLSQPGEYPFRIINDIAANSLVMDMLNLDSSAILSRLHLTDDGSVRVGPYGLQALVAGGNRLHRRTIDAGESTTSTTYVDLATPQVVDVKAPPSGMVLVTFRARFLNTGTNYSYVSFTVHNNSDGSLVAAAGDNRAIAFASTLAIDCGTSVYITGLAPGVTYRFGLKFRTNAGTATFNNRELIVVPSL